MEGLLALRSLMGARGGCLFNRPSPDVAIILENINENISWSPKKYEMGMGGISTLLPRAYQENISFNFTKVALND